MSDVTARAVEELLREGESQNTLVSYRSALRYWAAWFGLRYGVRITLPVPTPAVLKFIVDHVQRISEEGLVNDLPAAINQALVAGGFKGKSGPIALNTLVHRIAVLSKAHQLRALKNPCHDAKVKELLAMTRRAYAKRGALPRKKNAMTRDPLRAVLATCDESLRGRRDRALLLFAWSTGGWRHSEVATADLSFLTSVSTSELSYLLAHSKTNQAGAERAENHKPVVSETASALRDWLRAAGISESQIFRQIRKGGHLGGPLSGAAVRDIVRQRCALAGLEGDFSAHSLHSGFVTEAGRQAIPIADTMAMTGHRSIQSVVGYARQQSASSAASRLLEGSRSTPTN